MRILLEASMLKYRSLKTLSVVNMLLKQLIDILLLTVNVVNYTFYQLKFTNVVDLFYY